MNGTAFGDSKINKTTNVKYTAVASSTKEVIVASSIVKQTSPDGAPVGDLIRAVSIKHMNQTEFRHPSMQFLVHESHAIFSRAQRDVKISTLTVSDILSYSLQYRSIIRSALSTVPDSEPALKQWLTGAEFVWSLVEAIFIKTQDSSIVLDLMNWARLCLAHTPYVNEITKSLRGNSLKSLKKEHFWQQIIYFVLCGMFNNAVSFLETYEKLTRDESARNLAKVLSELNVDLLNDEDTAADFISAQEEVRNLCSSGIFQSNLEAQKVALIVAGDIPTIRSVALLLDNWFELVPPYLLFVRPRATLPQLRDAVKDCLEIFGITKCSGMDAALCELFSLEAVRALHRLSTTSANWWFPAHLADLLQKADERITNAFGVDVRQYLIIEYGSSLFSEPGLWNVGFDYLRESGDEGLKQLELLVGGVPLDNEMVATKLCSLCDEVGLGRARMDITRAMAYRLLHLGQWGSALSWAIRSRDIEIVSLVADQVISRCVSSEFSSIAVVEHFIEVMLLSSSFVFLHRYYKFRKLLELDEKARAADLLVELIVSNIMPRKFDEVLFSDLISLLNNEDEVIISKDGTEQLLQHLILYEADGPLFEQNLDTWKMRLRTLRYMLLQNLARAITGS